MNFKSISLNLIFFFYLLFLLYSYVRPVEEIQNVRGLISFSDNIVHFFAFFILGILAQMTNDRENKFIFGVTLSIVISLFIEFTHYLLPYREFLIIEGIMNILGCLTAIYSINYLRKKKWINF